MRRAATVHGAGKSASRAGMRMAARSRSRKAARSRPGLAGAAAVVVLTGGLGRLRDAWTGSTSAAGEGQRPGKGPGLGAGQMLARDADPLLAEAERELERAAVSYEQAVNRLRKILDYEKTLWDPETRARVDDRLARLDEAVDHSRAVARRDPGDSAGADMLFSAYRRQIDFLAEAVHRGSPATAEGFR